MTAARTCRTCSGEKPLDDFPPDGSSADGRAAHCRSCSRAKRRAAREAVKTANRACPPIHPPGTLKRCPACRTDRPVEAFMKCVSRKDGLQTNCKPCHDAKKARYVAANRERVRGRARELGAVYRREAKRRDPRGAWALEAAKAARKRARERGLPCDIDRDFLVSVAPDVCPVLGIPLDYACLPGRKNDRSPTVDRRVPELGYVRGNVTVMSDRANRIKNDSTPEELAVLVSWLAGALAERGMPSAAA